MIIREMFKCFLKFFGSKQDKMCHLTCFRTYLVNIVHINMSCNAFYTIHNLVHKKSQLRDIFTIKRCDKRGVESRNNLSYLIVTERLVICNLSGKIFMIRIIFNKRDKQFCS